MIFFNSSLEAVLKAGVEELGEHNILKLLESSLLDKRSVAVLNLVWREGSVNLCFTNLKDLSHLQLLHPEKLRKRQDGKALV